MSLPEGSEELTLDAVRMTVVASLAFGALIVIAAFAARKAWDVNLLKATFETPGTWVSFLVLFPLGIVIHEALHALTWAWAGRSWAPVKFGFSWKHLMPYAHYGQALPVGAYRLGAAMPLVVMGLVPLAVALAIQSPVTAGWAVLFIGAAFGDIAVLWAIRRVPGDARVMDHPSLPGCIVLPRAAA